MKPDPPVRKDGRCVVCLEPRKPELSRKYGKQHADLDPFCSTECAKKYHGVRSDFRIGAGIFSKASL